MKKEQEVKKRISFGSFAEKEDANKKAAEVIKAGIASHIEICNGKYKVLSTNEVNASQEKEIRVIASKAKISVEEDPVK